MAKILITGASGFIGRALTTLLHSHELWSLVRAPKPGKVIVWNPQREEIPLKEFEGFDAVFHLAGRSIAEGRWTKRYKEEIFLSRCRDTWLLARSMSRLEKPPKFFFSTSAVGFYGDRGDEILTEESPIGKGFLSTVCQRWEEATEALGQQGVRVVHGRLGTVISPEGGMLQKVLPLYRHGFGSRLGNGQQWMSWIALKDAVRAMEFFLLNTQLKGTFNLVAPYPVRNAEFTKILAEHVGKKPFLPIPAFILKLAFGDMARELMLASARVLPHRLEESGFTFEYPDLISVLNA
ncbi:MAG: TIGR01777 family oxidoreductase [Verrucomicrobia bacterium]|nr:TIGR01777 family oxidoreductase [Verrucomicrobiota bacterium]